jgi:hypothetical protein
LTPNGAIRVLEYAVLAGYPEGAVGIAKCREDRVSQRRNLAPILIQASHGVVHATGPDLPLLSRYQKRIAFRVGDLDASRFGDREPIEALVGGHPDITLPVLEDRVDLPVDIREAILLRECLRARGPAIAHQPAVMGRCPERA